MTLISVPGDELTHIPFDPNSGRVNRPPKLMKYTHTEVFYISQPHLAWTYEYDTDTDRGTFYMRSHDELVAAGEFSPESPLKLLGGGQCSKWDLTVYVDPETKHLRMSGKIFVVDRTLTYQDSSFCNLAL